MKAINFHIDPELHQALKLYAVQNKTSISQLLTDYARRLTGKETPKKAGSK